MFVGQKSGLLKKAEAIFKSAFDGQPRAELDDSPSRLLHSSAQIKQLARKGNALPLCEFMAHPRLFDAYPALVAFPVHLDPTRDFCDIATPNNVPSHMTIGTLPVRDAQGRLMKRDFHTDTLHEVQHHVQLTEGFNAGASLIGEELKERQRRINRLFKIYKNGGNVKEAMARIKDVNEGTGPREEHLLRRAEWRYFYTAGEVEARDTESRLHLNLQERQSIPPDLQLLGEFPTRVLLENLPAPILSRSSLVVQTLSDPTAPAANIAARLSSNNSNSNSNSNSLGP